MLGGGYRRNIIDIKVDTSKRYELDLSAGIMQELEILNTPDGFTAIEDQKLEILQELYFRWWVSWI